MNSTHDLEHATARELARYIRDHAGEDGLEDAARLAEAHFARLKELELLYVAGAGRAAISPVAREMFADHLGLLQRLGAEGGGR
jgi:hypothetical protein